MDWSSEALYEKSCVYVQRAHDEQIESPLFGFWTALALELLCRAALAKIHPVLLADPTNEGNIHYAFGINPKTNPRSVSVKTVCARCSVFIPKFTDKMAGHCLILADRRNSELHSGAASFEDLDNSAWLPATYETMEVLLEHLGKTFESFLGEHYASTAEQMLRDRRESLRKEVLDRIAAAKKLYEALKGDQKKEREQEAGAAVEKWTKGSPLRRACTCPACGQRAGMTGESLNRGPVRIDAEDQRITREVRVLPNALRCFFCHLRLDGFQELLEAGRGAIYTVTEEDDPIEFFGIVPEEHVDVDDLIRRHFEDGYQNE